MMWPRFPLDEIKAPTRYSFVGGPFGSNLTTRDYVDEGVPVIRGNNLPENSTFLDDDFVFVNEQKAEELTSNLAHPGDLIFTQRGTLGQVGLIPAEPRFASYVISQSQMKLTVDPEKADARFIYFYFRSPATVQSVINHALTSGVPHINLGILKRFVVPLPPLATQRRIAEVLTAYDELMENNRRRMALLEEGARQLYAEWFVRLRYPGHGKRMKGDALPKGWTRRPLGEVAEFRLGKMLDQQKNRGDMRPYLANVNVRWGSFELGNLREMRFEDDELEAYGLKFGDIVMCEGGEPGRCAIWKEQIPGMMIQKALHRIRCRETMSHEYLYHALRDHGQSGRLEAFFTGATIKHLPREKLAKVTVVVPLVQLMGLFTEHVRPLQTQLSLLDAANKRASEARDLLLPRLMSGEIAV